MAQPWFSRLYHFLVGEDAPVLIVATPLVKDEPPAAPLTIVVPSKHVTSVLEKIAETRQGKRSLVVEGQGEKRAVKAKPKHKGKRR